MGACAGSDVIVEDELVDAVVVDEDVGRALFRG